MYKAEQFTRKPTKAASIAMWVKSRKPGLVRWFDVDNGAGSPSKDSVRKLVKVPKNQWIHLAGTFDSKDGIARVYVNGKLISETVGKKNKGLPDDFTATGIGQKFGDKFISFLDDVFMFDRVISPAEVRVLYKKCEFNRMVLHFGFQKVNTTTHQVMDQSGLDNNATLDGGKKYNCDKSHIYRLESNCIFHFETETPKLTEVIKPTLHGVISSTNCTKKLKTHTLAREV